MDDRLRVALIVNPIAGMGGFVGLKGTDGAATVQRALNLGAKPTACSKARRALRIWQSAGSAVEFLAPEGDMGGGLLNELGIGFSPLPRLENASAASTRKAAEACGERNADLIVFAGGDGTARDLTEAVGTRIPMLGIPCGVKMHSGVFAVIPEAAGRLLADLARSNIGELPFREAEIMDADEGGGLPGRIATRLFGYARTPSVPRMVQSGKSAPTLSDEAMLNALGEEVASEFQKGVLYLVGPGTTAKKPLNALGLPSTLLGVDAAMDGKLVASDVTGPEAAEMAMGARAHIVVGVTGGQGFVFGRGNQQIAPDLIRMCWPRETTVLASAEKLLTLPGGALLADTGDPGLDEQVRGFKAVRTGPRRSMMMPIV